MPLSGGHSLPEDLYSADAVREIDRYVIDQQGVDGFDLMQAAAAGAFRRLVRNWPEPGRVLVLCGAGNNGGDGYLRRPMPYAMVWMWTVLPLRRRENYLVMPARPGKNPWPMG